MFGSLLATRLLVVSFYHFNKLDVALSGRVEARCVGPDAVHLCGCRAMQDAVRTSHKIRRCEGRGQQRPPYLTSPAGFTSVHSKTNSLPTDCITFPLSRSILLMYFQTRISEDERIF